MGYGYVYNGACEVYAAMVEGRILLRDLVVGMEGGAGERLASMKCAGDGLSVMAWKMVMLMFETT